MRRVGRRSSRCSLHSRITLGGTVVLPVIGFVAIAAVEWNNWGTLGGEGAGDRVLGAFFASVQPRTAGFNAMDYGEARVETILVTQTLMLIGGGSAPTAGGLKVGTFVVLMLVVRAEARGRDEAVAFCRFDPRRRAAAGVRDRIPGPGRGLARNTGHRRDEHVRARGVPLRVRERLRDGRPLDGPDLGAQHGRPASGSCSPGASAPRPWSGGSPIPRGVR